MKSNIFNLIVLFLIISCGGGGGSNSSTNPGDVLAFNPSIDSFTSSSYSLTVGGSVNLTWSTTNAISCTASGDWTGEKTNSDSPYNITLNQVRTYVFTLTCRGEDPTNTVSETIEVVVSRKTIHLQVFMVKIKAPTVLHHQTTHLHTGLKIFHQMS